MDSLSFYNIDELVKTSKKLQNKLRQELKRQAVSLPAPSREENNGLPPVWDRTLLRPYLRNVVADHLTKGLESQISLQSSRPLATPLKLSSIGGTQLNLSGLISQESVHSNIIPKKPVKATATVTKKKTTKKSEVVPNQKTKKKRSELRIPPAKIYPFQRFIGSSRETVDFSKEHPHLELDMSSSHPTLFPRRLIKGAKQTIAEDVNVAGAKTKPPITANTKASAPVGDQHDTWRSVLQKNPVVEKPRNIQKLGRSKTIVNSFRDTPHGLNEEPQGPEVITNPANGLFRIERPKERLFKRKQCKSQHFPVMYIRPERQVQQLPNISIGGIDAYASTKGSPPNVKYVECVHDWEKPEELTNRTITLEREADVPDKYDNKFFKALEENFKLRDYLSSEPCLSSPSITSKTARTFPSELCSSENVQPSPSPPISASSGNDVQDIIDKIRLIPVQTERREVHVQTDSRRSVATSPMPESELSMAFTPITAMDPIPVPCDTTKQAGDENSIEDDIIAKIFERIQKDSTAAVKLFKARYHAPREEGSRQVPPVEEQCQETSVPNQIHQLPNNNESNVDSETESADDEKSTTPSPYHPSVKDKVFQTRLTPPKIHKSSAVPNISRSNAGQWNAGKPNYPTDAEIKRAVKMFLDSLTLQDNPTANTGSRMSMTRGHLPRPITKLPSCPSKPMAQNDGRRGKHHRLLTSVSSTSSSSSDFEDDEFESDDQISDRTVSDGIAGSHSEGEVLSLGEV